MQKENIEIINQLGLHARAAAKLVATTSKFQSKITLSKDGKSVDGKSIMSVMMLAASIGTVLEISIEGEDEEQAMSSIAQLINDKFGEEN